MKSCTFEKGNALKSIGNYAFDSDEALESIIIPKSVETIGTFSFYGCKALKSLTFEKGSVLKSIGGYAFKQVAFEKLVIPKSVETLGSFAFNECKALKSCTFEEGSVLKSIGGSCFKEAGIESIKIPKGVASINDSAFYGCDNLTSIDTEDGSILATIANNAIYNDKNLESIRLTSSNLTSVGNLGLTDSAPVTGLKITAHRGSKDAPSAIYQHYLTYKDSDKWEFSSEGICRSETKVEVKPTCVTPGSITYKPGKCKCSNVLDTTTKVITEPATGIHTFNKVVIDRQATYTKTGLKHIECSVCGLKLESSDEVIPMLVKEDNKNNNDNDGNSTSNRSTVTKTGSDKTGVNNPQTSDEMNMVIYLIMGLVSLGAVGTVGYKIKKKNI